MKFKVTAEQHAALSTDMQALYSKQEDGSFVMAIEGMPEIPDVAGLKAKVEELLGEKKTAQTAAAAAEEAAAEAAREAAAKAGDVDTLNASWQAKYDNLQGTVDSLNGTIASMTSGAEASRLAGELAVQGSADVLLPHLTSRLKTEMVDGLPRTVVVDSQGKPSALTIPELKAEFENNAAFASVIVGSKAGGGGTNNDKSNTGGEGKVISRSQFEQMGAGDRMKFTKEGGTLTDEV